MEETGVSSRHPGAKAFFFDSDDAADLWLIKEYRKKKEYLS